jgi:hypothetical protein
LGQIGISSDKPGRFVRPSILRWVPSSSPRRSVIGRPHKLSERINYSQRVLNAPEFRESPHTTRGRIGDLGRPIDHSSPSISQGASRTCRALRERQRATRGRPNPPSRSCSPIGHRPPPDRMHPPKPPPPRSRSPAISLGGPEFRRTSRWCTPCTRSPAARNNG